MVELRDPHAGLDHAGGIIHHDYRARTQAGADLAQGVKVHVALHDDVSCFDIALTFQ